MAERQANLESFPENADDDPYNMGENEDSGLYDAKARRLQKNRESARESRLRKKNYMERQEAKCQNLIK